MRPNPSSPGSPRSHRSTFGHASAIAASPVATVSAVLTDAPASSRAATVTSRLSRLSSTTSTFTVLSEGRRSVSRAPPGVGFDPGSRQRQRHGERGALARAAALRVNGATVLLDEMPHDRQAEAEASMRPLRRHVGLTERVEQAREKLRRNSDARVADGEHGARPHPAPCRSTPCPPSGVNLIAFESRFQKTCCRRSGSPARLVDSRGRRRHSTITSFSSAFGLSVFDRPLNDGEEVDGHAARAFARSARIREMSRRSSISRD